MARHEQEPTITRGGLHGDDIVMHHPAYGQIAVSRVTGRTALYGSDFNHHSFISFRVYGSRLCRSMGRDWPYGEKVLLELELSEAQWATFVSSIGVGGGVQCTLRYNNGEHIPSFPLRDEATLFEQELHESLADAKKLLNETSAMLKEQGADKPRSKLNHIWNRLNAAIREITGNLPFVEKQFGEHMEQRVEKAKIEINAYATQTLMRVGLDHQITADDIPLALENHRKDNTND